MFSELSLKQLTRERLELAIKKASVYRDLNQPEEAESICLDVLAVDPGHQAAIRLLGLALTDKFGARVGLFEEAIEVFSRLTDPYERVYHTGVAWERHAKAQIERGEGHNAVVGLEHALTCYAEAERIGPRDSPDPILRWNRCVRLLTTHPLLVEAANRPRTPHHLGD